jgi:methylglutaconyl-CoA hydratase
MSADQTPLEPTLPRHISVVNEAGTVTLTMERPNVHNAFDAILISEMTAALGALSLDTSCRQLVLTGRGASFSAGADVSWMQSQLSATEAENQADARNLAQLMRTLAFFPKPTIAKINGAAFGGGVGLIACCDIAISVAEARFGLTETKLGLAPAVISPYVIDAIGTRNALRYFQTAELFDATRAQAIGLIHEVVPAAQLDVAVTVQLKHLRQAGPNAVKAAKALVHRVAGMSIEEQMFIDEENAKLIAKLRVSAEGQEGLSAFLSKRRASWTL